MIVGYGNPSRGDDAAGLLVARRLRELGVPALEFQGDAAALMEIWADVGSLILVDAVVSGAPPGFIHRLTPAGIASADEVRFVSSHALGLREAVLLSQALGTLPSEVRIYGIEAASCEPGAEVSPEVQAAVELLARELHREYLGTDLKIVGA